MYREEEVVAKAREEGIGRGDADSEDSWQGRRKKGGDEEVDWEEIHNNFHKRSLVTFAACTNHLSFFIAHSHLYSVGRNHLGLLAYPLNSDLYKFSI